MLGYLSLDIICPLKLTVFLELRSQKTVRFSEQIMSADKYPSIFSPQMETIVYLANFLPVVEPACNKCHIRALCPFFDFLAGIFRGSQKEARGSRLGLTDSQNSLPHGTARP